MTLHSIRMRSLYVAPIRLGLAVVWFFAARAAGVGQPSAALAGAGGIFVIVFVAFNDPRGRFLPDREPGPVPPEAGFARPLRQALAATLPSTVGVSVLAAVALAFQPVLTALLGGISAGLGVTGLLSVARSDPALWFDRKTGIVYRR